MESSISCADDAHTIPEPSVTKYTSFIALLFVVFSDFDISKLFLESSEVNSEL